MNELIEKYCTYCGARYIKVSEFYDGYNHLTGQRRIAHLYKCPNEKWYNFAVHDSQTFRVIEEDSKSFA